MYALVEILGKQYRAEKGEVIRVARMEGEKGAELEFDSVLLVSDDSDVKIGTPFVAGHKVKATIQEHGRAKKIVIFKYKKRKDYKKKQGHRQDFTVLRVSEIVGA